MPTPRHIGCPEDVPTVLRALREESGKSLRYVAAKTALDPSSLNSWEKGAHKPQLENLIKLLNWYGKPVTFGRTS